jgi:hypothetical protein
MKNILKKLLIHFQTPSNRGEQKKPKTRENLKKPNHEKNRLK